MLNLSNYLETLRLRSSSYDVALVEKAVRQAQPILASIIDLLPVDQRTDFETRVISYLDAFGDSVFTGVSPHLRHDEQYWSGLHEAKAARRGPGVVHLELGVSVAWPDSEAERFVEAEGLGDVIRLDFDPDVPCDIVASATALPFDDESIDRISSNSLMEHVAYPHEIIAEAFRVLRPGGLFIAAVPFHYVEHAFPQDHLRFTAQFFETVCQDFGFATVETDRWCTSGAFYVAHQLLKSTLVDRNVIYEDQSEKAAAAAHMLSLILLAAFSAFDDRLVAGGISHWHTTHCYAIKAGDYEPSLRSFDRSRPFVERFSDLICPASGFSLQGRGDRLETIDGAVGYAVENGVPDLRVARGFNALIRNRHTAKSMRASANQA